MTVPVPDQLEYISDANGVTKDFPYPKRFLQKDEIVVALRDSDGVDTPQILGTHYTIAGSSWPTGGTVSFITAPQAPNKVVRYRMTEAKQTVNLANNQKNDAPSVELQLDRMTMAIQDRGSFLTRVRDWLCSTVIALRFERAERIAADANLNGRVDQEIVDRNNGDKAVASLIGQAGPIETQIFDSFTAAQFGKVKATIGAVIVLGYSVSGDCPPSLYYRVESEPSHPGKMQMFDGSWWELTSTDGVVPEQFGARACPAPWGAVQINSSPDNTSALQNMIRYCEATGAVSKPTGRAYVLKNNSPGLEIGSGFRCKGAGTAWWQRGTIAGAGIDLSGATTLIFAGTGQKIRTAHGITSCRTSGGEVVNPNGGGTIALWSGYNNDANELTGEGATIKPFSAGVWVKPGSVDVDLDGLTVLLSYDGVDGYNTVANGLADDWDFGVFWDNARESHINLTTVGYWRQGGVLFRGNLYPNEIPSTRYGGLERVVGNLKAQGNTSVLMRGADHFCITDVTSTYVEVPWTSNHPFSATRQEMKMFGVGQVTVSSAFTITAIAKVGDKLRLTTNVNPQDYGVSTGQFIQPAWFGAGCAGFNIEVLAVGLFHQTGRKSETFGLSAGKGIEMSGARISRPIFTGRVNNSETVHTHLHTVDRPLLAIEWEGKTPSGGVAGGLNIASPAPSSNTRVPNPGPGTNIAQYQATQVLNSDFMPYFGAGTAATPNGGLFEPNAVSFDYFQFPPRARGTKPIAAGNGEDVILEPGNGARKFSFSTAGRITSDGEMIFRTSLNHRFEYGSTENMRIFGASGNVQFNGTQILSSNNNRLTLGSASVAMKDIFSVNAVTVTSDERSKNVRGNLTDAEKRAARKIMRNVKIYQLKAAVVEKGDEARLHVGFIAQTVRDILASEGLNPFKYGFLCEDEILETVERKTQKLVQKTVQREISHTHIVFEEGFAREIVLSEMIDEPVFERVRLLDASGNQIFNEDGSLKTVDSPVMVTELIDVEETLPSMEDDGAGNLVPKKRLSLRYEELFAFILGACDFPDTESVGN